MQNLNFLYLLFCLCLIWITYIIYKNYPYYNISYNTKNQNWELWKYTFFKKTLIFEGNFTNTYYMYKHLIK